MTPSRPTANFWNDGAAPFLHPGMNTRETAIMDYAEQLAGESVSSSKTANHTLALVDKGTVVEVNSAGSVTITVPNDSTVNFPVGSLIEVSRIGAGAVGFATAGGVTLLSAGAAVSLRAQYSSAVVRKRSANNWILVGDLA